jgi:uncharacterized protein involved in exopolysaccharide biosynthesis
MTFKEFLQLLRRNWLLLVIVPLVTAVSIYIFSAKEAKEYASDTTIYTGIASAYNIDKNNEGTDYTKNQEYSNLLSLINSRTTKQEVALRLLSKHLALPSYDSTILSPETYNRLHLLIEQPLRHKLVATSLEGTVKNLTDYLSTDDNNIIYKILNSDDPSYSFTALDKVTASQVGISDLLKIEYVADDAAVCQQTLVELTNVFIARHKQLQEGRNGSVVGYFGEAAIKARQRLDTAEKNLLAFQRANNLIDYDEQSESVAAQRNDLEQQANDLKMQYAGALSVHQALQKTAKIINSPDVNSQKIYFLSSQLTKLRTQIANTEVFNRGKTGAANTSTIQKLRDQAEQVELHMQESIDNNTGQPTDVQPINIKSLGEDLVRSASLVEELRAKLLVLSKQRDSFDKEYQKVAPLGAEKRKIERERVLAEKEYLSVVSNLDQSQIAQQSIELTSKLKVVDPPYLAPNRAKSKRLLLLLFGSFGALLTVIGAVAATELFNQSLRNPSLVHAKTKLPLFGILPENKENSVEQKSLFVKAEDKLARQLILRLQQKPATKGAYVIGVVSSHAVEGKSTVVASISAHFAATGLKTLTLLPSDHKQPRIVSDAVAFYSPLQGVNPKETLTNIAGSSLTSYEVIIVEFPALLEEAYPAALFQHLDLVLITVDASRKWEIADANLFGDISKVTEAPIEIVLNRVLTDFAENYLGRQATLVSKEQQTTPPGEVSQWQPQADIHSS